MKNKIASIMLFLLHYSIFVFAQEPAPKKTGKVNDAVYVNFTELAKVEKEKGLPFESKMAIEDEEEEGRDPHIDNPTTFASPMQKMTTSLPPSQNVKRDGMIESALPCVDFRGVINNSTARPPDTHGSVGFDWVMCTTNTLVRISNKQGVLISEQSFFNFFSPLGISTISDPIIYYDEFAHKFVFTALSNARAASAAVIFAISQTNDPTGGWWLYSVDVDANNLNWFDYPKVAINKNWIVITGNIFTNAGDANVAARVYALNKSQAYTGVGINFSFWDYPSYFSIAPALTHSSTEDRLWLVSNHSLNNGQLRLFNMTGTQVAPALGLGNVVTVGSAWFDQGAIGYQAGTSNRINLGGVRMLNAAYRNGVLWCAQNIGLPASAPTYAGIQMVALNPIAGTHIETIRIVDPSGATGAVYPAIDINSNNDICIGYSTFYNTGFASSAVTTRRGGSAILESYVYKGGEDYYTLDRFGDYSSSAVDPEDDKTFWVATEYISDGNTSTAGTVSWGTWWAKICPGSCINDQTVSGIVGNNYLKKFEVNNTIIATVQIGAGANVKLDAANKITLSPGFRANDGSKVQVYIEGCGGAR
jgi:hypothetical protein